MKLAEFDYFLPKELIAQEPTTERDGARMLVLDRAGGAWEHSRVRDLPRHLRSGDLLVFNESRVVKARLLGKRASGGDVECFVLRQAGGDEVYECLLRSSAKKQDLRFAVGDFADAEVVGRGETGPGTFLVRFEFRGARDIRELMQSAGQARDMRELMERAGHVPLPPYIARQDEVLDVERYQTVFARNEGSVAAPTAGLHFTTDAIKRLHAQGVSIAYLTLHIGLGTFQPMKAENIEDHCMHEELYRIDAAVLRRIRETKRAGGRVIAVGTTSARSLESWARGIGEACGPNWTGSTDLFLKPGEEFRVVDGLLTNFHLPKSTLFVLVAAFAGLERVQAVYAEAVRERYRFFSYGDCMLVL